MSVRPTEHRPAASRIHLLQVAKGLDIGGLERVVVDLSNHLPSTGFDVELAILNGERLAMAPALRKDVVIHELGASDVPSPRMLLRLRRLLRTGEHDIVHAHGPIPTVLVRVLAPRSTKIVSTSHTTWRQLNPWSRRAWAATAWRDSASICVSDAVAAGLPVRTTGVVVIPHGVDVDSLSTVKRTRPHRRGAAEPLCLITVASHRDVKNYPNLLRAIRFALDAGANVTITCIGEGPALEAHRRLSRELGLQELGVIRFDTPRLNIHRQIADSDALVVASDFEGQPLVVAEALALGVPVIATAVGRVPQLVTEQTGRVVPPRDPAALGRAIIELASAPKTFEGSSGSSFTPTTSWSLSDASRLHQQVYRGVLDVSPGVSS